MLALSLQILGITKSFILEYLLILLFKVEFTGLKRVVFNT